MKNLTWQNPEQLFVAQELINKVKSKCCGIKVYISMHNQSETEYEPIVWYGSSPQWNDNGINHGHYNNLLIAVHNPSNGQGWFFVGGMGGLYPSKNSAGPNDTRILRFKKSDVEYIY